MLDAKSEAQSSEATFVSEESAPAAVVPKKNDKLEIDRYFEALVKLDGSDLHLKVDQPPIMRVKGSLQRLKAPPIGHEQMKSLCFPMLDDRQMKILEDVFLLKISYRIMREKNQMHSNILKLNR